MEIELLVKKVVDAKVLRIKIPVRYEEEDIPNDFPRRVGDDWIADIDIDTGQILDWKIGESGEMYMKVCDEGEYELRDKKAKIIVRLEGDYVPNSLLPPSDGYGDYVHFVIDENGFITNWYKNPSLGDFQKNEDN